MWEIMGILHCDALLQLLRARGRGGKILASGPSQVDNGVEEGRGRIESP